MKFSICGQVRQKETKEPLAGLLVRVHDPEMILDDHLGIAVTDSQGHFSLEYSDKARQVLLEGRPDIYLAVYAPPRRLLLKISRKLQPSEISPAPWLIEVSQKVLGPSIAKPRQNQVEGGLTLSARHLTLDNVHGFQLPRLQGFAESVEEFGAPTVLEQVQHVLLPLGAKVVKLEIVPGPVTRKGRDIHPWPVQPLEMDVPDEPNSGIKAAPQHFVALNPKYNQRGGILYPKNLVTVGRAVVWKGLQRLAVRIQPVQYDSDGKQYLFYPELRYIVHYTPALVKALDKPLPVQSLQSRAVVDDVLADFLEQTDVHAYTGVWNDHFYQSGSFGVLPDDVTLVVPTPYMIISDEAVWNETDGTDVKPTRPPTQAGATLGGGIVAQFKRLAKWKTQRGVPARVVTVSQIIAEEYDDMTVRDGVQALDLQEVIRNFVWWAHKNWGVKYVLFGGDTTMIPMRMMTGYATRRGEADGWDCMRSNGDVKYIASCDIAKVRYDGNLPRTDFLSGKFPLLTHQSGIQIPFYDNVLSTHYPRWHFISEADFYKENTSTCYCYTPSDTDDAYYLVVEGNSHGLKEINDDYYWVNDNRKIPTDYYYAHAQTATQNAHDFDGNGNGFYGQYRWDAISNDEVPMDGFNVEVDELAGSAPSRCGWDGIWEHDNVWVGRAPVSNAAEAEAFVDKVLAYERLTKQGTSPIMGLDFLRKVVHASGYSIHENNYSLGVHDDNLNGGEFTYDASTQQARLTIKAKIDLLGELNIDNTQVPAGQPSVNHRLIARYGNSSKWVAGKETAEVEIPYDIPAAAGSPYWYFMEDEKFKARTANVTRYVQVNDLTEVNELLAFFWDPVGLTRPRVEPMRQSMLNWYPEFNEVQRIYRDHFEPDENKPEIIPLYTQNILDLLSEGPHFLTIRAHGGISGTGWLSTSHTYHNAMGCYIVFAMSCSTADPTNNPTGKTHSFGEKLVVTPGGGAVAYIGSARMDIDGHYPDWFWENLPKYRRLGPTAGQCQDGTVYHEFWRTYCRTLYGDPEMPVWVKMPNQYVVHCPTTAKAGDEVLITVNRSLHVSSKTMPVPIMHKKIMSGSENMNMGTGLSALPVEGAENYSGPPLKDHLVTCMAGWDPLAEDWDKSTRAEWFKSKKTDAQGQVKFKIPSSLEAEEVEITVCACAYASVSTSYTYKPVVRTLKITV